nr:PD40 domain-containing protein [Acidobacteriota bacterium]
MTPVSILRALSCTAGLTLLGIGGIAQGRRAMTVEDLIVAPRIADPQLSPDGRTVLYVRTTTDGKTGRRNADIVAVPSQGGGGPKALIDGEKTENTPRWSPDGKHVAWLANRDGALQV